ncbi:carbohydrate-binding domain-containing protein [Reichenbachiella agariperforans]|uniref:carbohydrate-binding domain-containing protein n=1 Tax=Reichenbachiella agariperforans TaxID=156994 RepID=UPI001C08E2B5|nr:carbohydrate-binding domain-containing protein [Reichenbachiella agariperforans]MBU2912642.1 carbohydrate-binding protein [Reichenbachiella agariperforans]
MKQNYIKKQMDGNLLSKRMLVTLALSLISLLTFAQTSVSISPKVQRYVGSVSQLDRTKYFNIHATNNDSDFTSFYNDYNVGKGRGFWGPFSYSNSKGNPVGSYPAPQSGGTGVRSVSRYIGTEHPAAPFKDGLNVQSAANWAAEYYLDFVDASGRPEFFEPMNEPFVHAKDFYTGPWSSSENDRIKLQMAELFSAVGAKFHATPELANMKILGYSSAWPSLELNNFGHWDENMKMFMDVAGANMDAFATHLYDGVNVSGQDNKRSGSNSEAILDLIETYSYTKWGTVKPHAISEYGAIEQGYGDNYSDIASIQTVRSINHMLFNLLERENKMAISIPFITGKAEWHITAANNYQPYQAVLFKPTNIGQPNPAGWEYTPRIHFYELWKDVKGKRIYVSSNNPDVQVQGFVDGSKLYVAINNLDEGNETVNLSFAQQVSGLQNVKVKSLKIYDQSMPNMSITTQSTAPSSITLIAGETVVLEYSYASNISFDNTIRSKKYYTSKHLQSILANTAISFTFNNVTTGTGTAVLHMGIGRKHNKSKAPEVKVNGTTVSVPSNWKGYDQANRDDFFGTIDIPVPMNLLQNNNTITVEFPDSDGHVSSMILEVSKYDQAVSVTDGIGLASPPSAIESNTTLNFTVNYSASTTRDLIVEFWSSTGWLGQGKTVVNAGSGSSSVSINLNTAPTPGTGYVIKTSIRPTNGNWTTALDTDQANNITVTAPSLQTPYGSPAPAVPGKVEAENYDNGGEGVAYHDTDATNNGSQYRSDGVDIEACGDTGGGYNIGWMNAGEWLEYSVNFTVTQNYDFFPRLASLNGGAQYRFLVDGVDVTGTKNLTATGGWQSYSTHHLRDIHVTSGTHIVRFEVISGGLNFNNWAAWQAQNGARIAQELNKSDLDNTLSVYPNPLDQDVLNIKIENETMEGTVSIYDMNGRLAYYQKMEGKTLRIQRQLLPQSGIYLLQFQSKSGLISKKLILE